MPAISDYRPGHIADTTLDTTLDTQITVAPIPATQQTTTVDPIAMMGDPIVMMVARTGTIGHIETGSPIEMIGRTATIIGTIGTTILTVARGAGLAIVPEVIAVAGTMTPWRITRAASPRFSCSITVEAGEYTYAFGP